LVNSKDLTAIVFKKKSGSQVYGVRDGKGGRNGIYNNSGDKRVARYFISIGEND